MGGKGLLPLLTGRAALLALLGCVLLPFAPMAHAWLWWLGYNGILLVAAFVDWWLSPRAEQLKLTADFKGRWVRGERQLVGLALANESGRPVQVRLRQDVPAALGGPAEALRVVAPAGAHAGDAYTVTARERGDHTLGTVHGRWASHLGLVQNRGVWERTDPVRVYAPLYIDRGPALITAGARLQEQGGAALRTGGVQTEFESLREYREGDAFRTVNWRASARRGHLVVNEYQSERTQQVMLVLDAGRLMVPEYRGVPRFEYALSAALQLGRLAASRDDRVGMMAFGTNVDMLLLPGRGQAQVARLAEAASLVQPQMVEPDYAGAFARLSGSLKRRSLVLFFTDFVSPGASRTLVEHLLRLVPRHMAVVMAISDPALGELARAEAATVAGAYSMAAADWALEERAAARAALAQRGIPVLDVPPLALSAAAINKYLAIKRQGQL